MKLEGETKFCDILKFCSILDSSTLGSTMGLWHDDAWLRLADELLWRDHRPSFEAWMRHATWDLLITAHKELRTALADRIRQRVTWSGPDTSNEQVENCAGFCLGLNSSSVDCYADNAGAESVEPNGACSAADMFPCSEKFIPVGGCDSSSSSHEVVAASAARGNSFLLGAAD